MATFARACVSGMRGAVIMNLQALRLQRLPQQRLDLVYDRWHDAVFTLGFAH